MKKLICLMFLVCCLAGGCSDSKSNSGGYQGESKTKKDDTPKTKS
jgi:hypothetical protein